MSLDRTPLVLGNDATIMSTLWENTFINKINTILSNAVDFTNLKVTGLVPIYLNTSTINISLGSCGDSTGAVKSIVSSPSAIDLTIAGSGGALQSANLTGTVSVAINTNNVNGSGTSFLSAFQVGDIIAVNGSSTRRIATIPTNTSMTTESNFLVTQNNVTYKRGGNAPNTHYYPYVLTNSSSSTIVGASTRNTSNTETLVDTPSGYTYYRQLPFSFRTDSAGSIIPFYVAEGWPDRPRICYEQTLGGLIVNPTGVLANTTPPTSFTDIDCSSFIPPISTEGVFALTVFRTADTSATAFRRKGETHNGFSVETRSNGSLQQIEKLIQTDSSRLIQYKAADSSTNIYVDVCGYVVTAVT